MQLLKKYKLTFLYRKTLNRLHFFGFVEILILLFLSQFNLLYLGVVLLFLYFLYRKNKRFAIVVFIFLLFFCGNQIFRTTLKIHSFEKNYEGSLRVECCVKKKDKYRYIGRIDSNDKVLFQSETYYESGTILFVKGTKNAFSLAHDQNGFNERDYYHKQGILCRLLLEEEVVQKKSMDIYFLHEKILQYDENHYTSTSANYLSALLFGCKDGLEDDFVESLETLGISHLFVISGLHLEILLFLLKHLLGLFPFLKKNQEKIILPSLFIYYALSGYLISVFRVTFAFCLSTINAKNNLHYSSLDLFSFNFVVTSILFVDKVYTYGFLLTYLISFSLILAQDILRNIQKIKSKIGSYFLTCLFISIHSFCISLPLVSKLSPKVSITSVINNLFYIPFVSYCFLPLSILTQVFGFLDVIYGKIAILFEEITKTLAQNASLSLTFGSLTAFAVLLYYVIYYFVLRGLEQKKKIYLPILVFFIFLFLWNNKIYFSSSQQVIFLDLPIGDATIIEEPHDKYTTLIDTGGNKSQSQLEEELGSRGIKKINTVILTHSDEDHIGCLEYILSNYSVDNIIYGKYDSAMNEMLSTLRNYNGTIHSIKKGDNFRLGKSDFMCLSPQEDQSSTNENSLVLYVTIDSTHLLFTGDIESKTEQKIVQNNLAYSVDILKLAHHASITSTTEAFLSFFKPSIAVGMNGYYNTFGFPSPVIETRLKKRGIPFFMTKEVGTVWITIKKKTYEIHTTHEKEE